MVVLKIPRFVVGRMIVNKWMVVAFIVAFVILEMQILQMSIPGHHRYYEYPGNLQSSDILRERRQFENNYEFGVSTRGQTGSQTEDDRIIIFYNRVPKTGSTSFMGVLYGLCRPNKFHTLHLNVSRNSHVMSLSDQMRFARNITTWKQRMPAVYHGHLAYMDFQRLGVYQSPLFINMIRKPLDRLVSYYYFLRFGDDFRPYLRRTRQGDKETFDECVQNGNPDCRAEKLWLQIPYFCGHAPQCWSPGNKWALEQAKRNLVEKYLLVGITEEMGDFVAILEAILPRIFKGATKVFNEGGKSHLRKTASKKPLEKSTIEYFEQSKIWKMESDFYEFANKVFQDAKKRALIMRDGVLEPVKKQFFYEKIRPKEAS